MKARPENILLIQLRQLGDILLTTPTIRALKQHAPSCSVSFLSHPMGKLILQDNPLLDEHIVMPSEGVGQQIKCFMDLRDRKFDMVFDLMGNPRSALATFATRAPMRVGFAANRRWAYNLLVPRISGSDYIVKEKFRILAAAGITGADERLMLPWNESHLAASEAYFNKAVAPSLRVVLSPTHRRLERKWPAHAWTELADTLVNKWKARVYWAWGPGEEAEVRDLQRRCSFRTEIAPKTSLRELAAFIAQCDLFVGNSNGPSHVAVAVNTPSIQLHGPTDAPSWCPMTARHLALQGTSMSKISVHQVLMLVESAGLRAATEESIRNQGLITNADQVWLVRPQL